ncbi:hypothetical protein CcaverHIS002_0211690 [Cutaneotrichosporon cavernicola]|uniref:WD40 repeat-like protein n=1 Tax=Cutaneotrichosporon cavernicola TaxID=279322 RepID=A0AA48IBL3_9TREE|nr:uncharacterized protein CcaverHIS019_0211690 [Cutaneotrichosporon cavernicola]BEI82009.1 hypothetical protein CcaverHIS002_0211690 [Cutaneotrichosporon cavernicola]BEI89807.1 hypothetical protein CcaverHIS019_0211690 [Cutaneotrichosporon cavernicola]BEI97577.1 hypothetical protein CcaverHIS631_0211660 [Cutaneotrichosporon cavernicola]BEJ05357.1 hypothetical protein CcaverHIS641_0211740 [Cutaneotrichosporon cavernicola]
MSLPSLHPARTHALSSRPYIVDIIPTSSFLALRHPEPEITLADRKTLQGVATLSGAHTAPVTAVCADSSIWSAGKDAKIVRWDERTQRPVAEIKAHIRKPLPVTALAVSEADNLVVGGTEVISSEAHILFWDPRNPSEPAYRHSSTHSDEITHLSLLSSSFSAPNVPAKLLLSGSVDGCVALSNAAEHDEDEAVQAEENWNASIAGAGAYAWSGGMRVWARSDMDTLAGWDVRVGADGLELGTLEEVPSSQFKARSLAGPSGPLSTEYLVTAAPSLGVGRTGAPVVAAGTNDGAVVLEYNAGDGYGPSAFLLPGGGAHADVVRCMYHAPADQALYTGSEDGVLAGWGIGDVALRTGADGEGEEAEMEVDGGERRDTREERRSKKEKRQKKRPAPY